VTGIYDDATVEAVLAQQSAWGKKRTGIADRNFFRKLGLVYTEEITTGSVDDVLLADIQKRYPNGITVAIYTDYDKKTSKNLEFRRRAEPFAAEHGAIGLDGNTLTMGKAIPIKELGDVVEATQSIHRGLLERYRAGLAKAGTPDDGLVPKFTQIKNLSLFAHGQTYGIGMDATGGKGRGIHNVKSGGKASNITSFVKGISGAVTADVNVQLYACNTARDANTKQAFIDWVGHDEGVRRGEKSFAAALAEALGEDASVFGHTTSGHTTRNYASRVFGKAAGGGKGGVQIFELLYDAPFIESELERIFPGKTPAEQAKIREPIREEMWDHYRGAVSSLKIGALMFIDMDEARKIVREDWKTQWVPEWKKKSSYKTLAKAHAGE
jgi:hypothetical protein